MARKPFEMIFFDLGNTLIYFDGSWQETRLASAQAMANQLSMLGYKGIDWEEFAQKFIRRLQYYYLEREMNCIEESADTILKEFFAEYSHLTLPADHTFLALQAMYTVSQAHWRPEEDCLPTLLTLHQRGYRLGIISNAAYSLDVETLIDKAQIRSFFETIIISANVGIRKPHPRIFQVALEAAKVRPDQALMVGDTLSADILGAQNSDLAGIWITRRADAVVNRTLGREICPTQIIYALGDLPNILDQWSSAEL